LGNSRLNPPNCADIVHSIDATVKLPITFDGNMNSKPMTGNKMALEQVGWQFSTRAMQRWILVLCVVATLVTPMPAYAQPGGFLDSLGGPSLLGDGKDVVTVTATATIDPNSGRGLLRITAKMKSPWYIYSITQPPGGPIRTTLKLDPKADAQISGKPKSLTKPHKHPEPAFDNLMVEAHEGEAIWEVPIQLKTGVDAAKAKINGAVNAQACSESCLPPSDYPFVAKVKLGEVPLAEEDPPQDTAEGTTTNLSAGRADQVASLQPVPVSDFRPPSLHVVLRGKIEPAVAAPGSIARLTIEAIPDAGWQVYALADQPGEPIGNRPTLIAVSDTTGLRFTKPQASATPQRKATGVGLPDQLMHTSPVSWTVDLEIPVDAAPGVRTIRGLVGLQTCQGELRCDAPRGLHFTGSLRVGAPTAAEPTGLTFSPAKYGEVEQAVVAATSGAPAASTDATTANEPVGTIAAYKVTPLNDASRNTSLPLMLFFAFLGGLILNLMPCVLPVVGLKVLAFAEQAGNSRAKIFKLNLWYTAGIVAVFLVLATLASGAKLGFAEKDLGWGQQFSNTAFNVTMAAVVFVMALSFLGVWEIPIPGFIGSGKAQKIASKEGAGGAFAKGIVTTLLATPCSGPFLGPVFGFTLTQSPAVIYALFAAIGLGMSFPYLVIGAFPTAIRWLPKPGAWMDTFKHIMGFVMLGTVVFIFSFMQKEFLVPTFGLLVGLWAACWWIGRTPTYEPLGKQLSAWLQGGAVAALVGWICFTQLVPGDKADAIVKWQPYSYTELTRLQNEGKSVLVDFTADWCLTCKANLKFSINTPEVASAVDRTGVVPLLADWTDGSDEIKQMLAALGSNSIPVLALFPANRPGEALVLKDTVTRSQVVQLVESARGGTMLPGGVADHRGGGAAR
jgi:thiol:disulfide interchange protein